MKNDSAIKKGGVSEGKEEAKILWSLRAQSWDEFIGQQKIKQSLSLSIDAAKKRGDAMEHTLFYGPPGLGKTTLSHLIAREMGKNIRVTSGPAIERAADLAAILTNLDPGDILFIDEIHRLGKVVEEMLYPAMEDFALDIIIGKGPSARTLRLELPKFAIVGATTRIGMVSSPLRDRFGVIHRLSFYSPDELSEVVRRGAIKLGIELASDAAGALALRARGTPRIALRLLKRARDMAQVHGDGRITEHILTETLQLLEVDELGLDQSDRRFMEAIVDKFSGGPVGVETLAASLSEDIGTIEEVIEPYLMQLGLIHRTARGRVVTPTGYKHLGRSVTSEQVS